MGPAIIIVGFILMIVIHEGGHFVAAKIFGMKATEAFFGFGPRVWSTQRGETEYGIKAIPLGGYVRIVGMNPLEEVDPAEEYRTYRQKPFWQKSIVVLAGIASHFVVAFILFYIVALAYGSFSYSTEVREVSSVLATSTSEVSDEIPLDLEKGDVIVSVDGVPFKEVDPAATKDPDAVAEVVVERNGALVTLFTTDLVVPPPALLSGFQAGDVLISFDGIAVDDWDRFVELTQERPGKHVAVVVERDGQEQTIEATLASVPVEGGSIGFLGLSSVVVEHRYGLVSAVPESLAMIGTTSSYAVQGLWGMVSNFTSIIGEAVGQGDGDVGEVRPVSVVGLVRIAGPVQDALFLLGFVNVFVGILNLVPLFPLDGGHFAVALYEKVRGRPADVRKLLPVAAVVFAFIIMLGLLGLYFDIVDPIQLPG